MSTVYFTGRCKWARLQSPDEKYRKYGLSLGLDAKQYKEMQGLKIRNGGKLDDEGVFWVNFSRPEKDGPPKVIDPSNNAVTSLVGNDSEVTVKLEIKSWTNRETGNLQYAAKLDTVCVDKLVIYEAKSSLRSDFEKKEQQPSGVGAAVPPTAPSSLPQPKRLF